MNVKAKNKSGFTLVETLVALFVFSLIAGVLLQSLFSAVSNQRSLLGDQRSADEGSFVGEYMSRALRQAREDATGTCISAGVNYEIVAASTLRFLDRDNKCREFLLDGGSNQLQERISLDETSANLGTAVSLTSNDIEIRGFELVLDGAPETDDRQPRITFSIEMKPIAGDGITFFQSTISQRRFDVLE